MRPTFKITDFNKLSKESRDSVYNMLLREEISQITLDHDEKGLHYLDRGTHSVKPNTLVFTTTYGFNPKKKYVSVDWFDGNHIIRNEIRIKEDKSGVVSNLDEIDDFVLAKAFD